MVTIERFIGPLGISTSAEARALLDYSSYSGEPDYSATGGWNNGPSIKSTVLMYYGIYCSAAKTKVVGFWIREAGNAVYDGGLDPAEAFARFKGPEVYVYNSVGTMGVYNSSRVLLASTSRYVGKGLTHVEMKLFSDSSNGTIEIKINGELVLSGSGLDTGGADITRVDMCPGYDNNIYRSGIFTATDWVGMLRPALLVPISDESKQFSPSAGSDNFAMIDEASSDGDSTYVQSNTVGHKDLYGFSTLEVGLLPKVVSLVSLSRDSDAGSRSLQHLSLQDAIEREHVEKVLAAEYPTLPTEAQITTLSLCPDGTEITRAKLNAIKWGFKVSA